MFCLLQDVFDSQSYLAYKIAQINDLPDVVNRFDELSFDPK